MKAHPFGKLIQSTIHMLQTYSMEESIEVQAQSKGVLQNLRTLNMGDLHLNEQTLKNKGIGIRSIFDKGNLRITLYYIPPGQIMRLHNHPTMMVISFILAGKMEAKVYSPTKKSMVFSRQINILETGSVGFIDGMRTQAKNLHQFKAIEGTYFVDILFPDYDKSDRQCMFLEQAQACSATQAKLQPVGPTQIDFFEI